MTRFTPYEGRDGYIFTSYSRENTDVMLEVMNTLREKKYRVWYDEGIPVGNDWPLYIANHLNDSRAVVCFLSGAAMVSPNCFSEIKTAHIRQKSTICIALDESAEILADAVKERRSLTDAEICTVIENTEKYARKRKSNTKPPRPEEWLEALSDAVFLSGKKDGAAFAEGILETGIITEEFRGSYDTDTGSRKSFNRWLVAVAACVILLAGLTYEGVKVFNGYTGEIPAPEAAEAAMPMPAPTVDPELLHGLLSSSVSFPDAQQERAVRQATGISEGEVEDTALQGITSLSFCGKTVLSSPDGISYKDGKWTANGAPVAQGEIKDLSVIKTMYYLEELTAVYQRIDSAAPLRELPVLRRLDVSGNPLIDINLAEGFGSLETLNISHTRIRSLVSTAYPPSLRTVYVSTDMLPMELPEDAPFEVVLTK